MRQLQTGLWHWEAPHPDWKPGAEWGPEVSSYAIDDGDRLLLLDRWPRRARSTSSDQGVRPQAVSWEGGSLAA